VTYPITLTDLTLRHFWLHAENRYCTGKGFSKECSSERPHAAAEVPFVLESQSRTIEACRVTFH